MGVPRYTTPTFELTFTEEGLDLTQAAEVYVTFQANGCKITKTGEDLEVAAKKITVLMSQEETGGFPEGPVRIQANWLNPDGKRIASAIAVANISAQLLQRVIE